VKIRRGLKVQGGRKITPGSTAGIKIAELIFFSSPEKMEVKNKKK
jgi:hypothetical protein